MKILLIEDDDVCVNVLTRMLKAHHYIVDTVKDGELGWTYGSTFEYDLIVLDVVLPKLDGVSFCQRFRSQGYVTPILLLTSQDTNTAKVQGLNAGADDYMVKPFDQAELIARIRALLRRSSTNPFPLLTCGELVLNPSTCEVSYQGQNLTLTNKEYELLELMMRDSQHVFSTEDLMEHLWTSEEFPSEATVRSHIRRVRNKLVAIGAPSDFIATMHGRGYYLKASGTDTALPSVPTQNVAKSTIQRDVRHLSNNLTPRLPEENSVASDEQQYLAFLNATWATTKPNSIEQVAILLQAVNDLQVDRLTNQHQVQAQQLAHKLAGTLSIFGLNKAVHLSRQLEHWLGSQYPLQPNQAPLMQKLVLALQQEIDETTLIQLSKLPNGPSPLLLLVSADAEFNQSLEKIAVSHGIQLEVLPFLDENVTLGSLESIAATAGQSLKAILLRLASRQPHFSEPSQVPHETQLFLQVLQECNRRYPALPVVVMGDCTNLNDRLEVARRGSKLFLDCSAPPEQVIVTAINQFKGSPMDIKVMIVDDDDHWLCTLPTLLKPWGFKVTTLADPQQFWMVLQELTPDVLVLDVNMPRINGFELCQILRSDPQWQRLPVLFLSVLTDSASQQKAFHVGADDYLCKPLMGNELADRILNRLQRVRAWAS